MGDDVGDTLSTKGDTLDFEKLVSSFFGGYAVDGKTTLDIVEDAEVFARLFNGENICELII